jgi:glycosyltransferase involved in cell wall biosynthesis
LKLLFISHVFWPQIGGIEVNTEILCGEFLNMGHDVILLTSKKTPLQKDFGFKVVRAPSIIQLIRLINDCDVVFENNPCLRISWPLFFLRKKSVVAVRTVIERSNGSHSWQDLLKLWRLKKTSKVIAVSEYVRRVTYNESIVIGNPYRKDLFKNLQKIKRTNSFVYIGRLVSDKGVDIALRALRLCIDSDIDFRNYNLVFTIIGDGPERQHLERLTKDLKIGKYVRFLGSKVGDDLVQELNSHLSIIVPSRWREPFGNVALEGMACGCIPIVSNGGGLPEAIGKAGLVFERENIEDLYDKMKIVMTDIRFQQNLLDEQKGHLALHDPNVIAKKYLEVIKSALN